MIGNISNKVLNAKSIFNQRYQIVLSGGVHAKEAVMRPYSCLESVKRFIFRDLDITEQAWKALISSQNSEAVGPSPKSVFDTVAELIWRGRISIYELPSLTDHKLVLSIGQNKGLRVINAEDASLYSDEAVVNFNSPAEAAALLGRVQSNNQVVEQALSHACPGEDLNLANTPAKETLQQKVMSGELKVIEVTRQIPRTRFEDAVEDEMLPAEALSNKSIPLAPESPKFSYIEIQLVYDNGGEPVADQAYKIKDSQGNEYTGKTDSEGMARLDNIPVGKCEVRFPDLAGWE